MSGYFFPPFVLLFCAYSCYFSDTNCGCLLTLFSAAIWRVQWLWSLKSVPDLIIRHLHAWLQHFLPGQIWCVRVQQPRIVMTMWLECTTCSWVIESSYSTCDEKMDAHLNSRSYWMGPYIVTQCFNHVLSCIKYVERCEHQVVQIDQ